MQSSRESRRSSSASTGISDERLESEELAERDDQPSKAKGAVDAVPSLKGGSAIGVPSPPEI